MERYWRKIRVSIECHMVLRWSKLPLGWLHQEPNFFLELYYLRVAPTTSSVRTEFTTIFCIHSKTATTRRTKGLDDRHFLIQRIRRHSVTQFSVANGNKLISQMYRTKRESFIQLRSTKKIIFTHLSGQSFWLQIQRSRAWFPALPDFLRSRGSGTGSSQPREDNWGATWMKK
jgi:hypothetical protein